MAKTEIDNIKDLKEIIKDLDDDIPVRIYGLAISTVYPVWGKYTEIDCEEHNGKQHKVKGFILTTDDSLL
jgi:hypothetical protein